MGRRGLQPLGVVASSFWILKSFHLLSLRNQFTERIIHYPTPSQTPLGSATASPEHNDGAARASLHAERAGSREPFHFRGAWNGTSGGSVEAGAHHMRLADELDFQVEGLREGSTGGLGTLNGFGDLKLVAGEREGGCVAGRIVVREGDGRAPARAADTPSGLASPTGGTSFRAWNSPDTRRK